MKQAKKSTPEYSRQLDIDSLQWDKTGEAIRGYMRVLITGPLGYIGRPVAEAFCAAGHQVSGLVRNDEKAKALMLAGIEPVVGNLSQPDSYRHAVEQAEVVIHTAFDSSANAVDIETGLVKTLTAQCLKSGRAKALVYTSGVWVHGSTGSNIVDESSELNPIDLVSWRMRCEKAVLEASTRTFRTLVIRPGVVYGGAGGLTSLWFSSALQGSVEVVGHGQNHWPMIHQQDLARLYLLASEQELTGIVLNAVDNSHYSVMEMAQAVSGVAGIHGKVNIVDEDAANDKYGKLTEGLLIDQHISNERARRLLSWSPRHRTFIDGIQSYYSAWMASQG